MTPVAGYPVQPASGEFHSCLPLPGKARFLLVGAGAGAGCEMGRKDLGCCLVCAEPSVPALGIVVPCSLPLPLTPLIPGLVLQGCVLLCVGRAQPGTCVWESLAFQMVYGSFPSVIPSRFPQCVWLGRALGGDMIYSLTF